MGHIILSPTVLAMFCAYAGSVALADVPTCPYCEIPRSVQRTQIVSDDLIKLLENLNDGEFNPENCYRCSNCFAKYIDGIWYSRGEWDDIYNRVYENRYKKQVEAANEIKKNRITTLIAEYGWTRKCAERVLEGYIYIGDTKEIVLESWGQPEDINRTTTAYGTTEQWVYGLGCYIYFENGKVTAIQD